MSEPPFEILSYKRVTVVTRELGYNTGAALGIVRVDFAHVQQTILSIEDDPAIRRGIVDACGSRVTRSCSPEMARRDWRWPWSRARSAAPDLVLPGLSGLEILREVRRLLPTQPVINPSARGEEDDRVAGLSWAPTTTS